MKAADKSASVPKEESKPEEETLLEAAAEWMETPSPLPLVDEPEPVIQSLAQKSVHADGLPQIGAAEELITRGQNSLMAGDLLSAESYLNEALSLAPAYGPIYYWMAKVFAKRQDTGRAQQYLGRASSLLKDDAAWTARIQQLNNEI